MQKNQVCKKDPTAVLEQAVQRLEAFNRRNALSSVPSLQKTIRFMSHFFSALFSERKRLKQYKIKHRIKNKLLGAIEVLKSHYLLIELLKRGTLQEQELASNAIGAVEKFNALIDEAKSASPSIPERISGLIGDQHPRKLIRDMAKIHFPQQSRLQIDYSPSEAKTTAVKELNSRVLLSETSSKNLRITGISHAMAPIIPSVFQEATLLSPQSLELLHMKVISLLESCCLLNHTEARKAIKKALVYTEIDPKDPNLCLASCLLSPFRGHTILVTGHFSRATPSQQYTIPHSKSFKLSLTAHETGFPSFTARSGG